MLQIYYFCLRIAHLYPSFEIDELVTKPYDLSSRRLQGHSPDGRKHEWFLDDLVERVPQCPISLAAEPG